ncbi:hypothetical protein J1N35_019419 [Gossypium stocksii]|uniref:Aminotransferase class V domain-containing protein n=1 Tax=Gossypium stocksii TaxID=47602 RepID=A0A9D3VRY2_9ROSI|nr:hypothetical protein J1N35_019419 [Gossypium stocksii]
MDYVYGPGKSHLFVLGPVNIPEPVLRAMNRNNEDYRSPAIPAMTKTLLEDVKKIFKTTTGTPFLIPTTGTGAWESALTNTLSPGDRTVSFLIGQFSLLWIDQQQRLNFNVDVIESEWGQGANLDILAEKLAANHSHSIKAICIVHNETATGVTNNLATVRKLLGKQWMFIPVWAKQQVHEVKAITDIDFCWVHIIKNRLAVEAWGLKNCTQREEWYSDTVTAVLVPPYIDSAEIVKRAWKRYNMSLGLGLNKVAGKVFRIGHLGNLNELQLLGCLAGVEMILKDVGYPVKLASGVAAACAYLQTNIPMIPSRI